MMPEETKKIDDNTVEIKTTMIKTETREELEHELKQLENARLELDSYYDNHIKVSKKQIDNINNKLAILNKED